MRQSIADLKQKMVSFPRHTRSRRSPWCPEISSCRAQVASVRAVMKRRLTATARCAKQIALYQSRLQLKPQRGEQYKLLTRDYQTALDFYNGLLKEASESAMVSDMNHPRSKERNSAFSMPRISPKGPPFPPTLLS